MVIHSTPEHALLTGGTGVARVEMPMNAALAEGVHTTDECHRIHEISLAQGTG